MEKIIKEKYEEILKFIKENIQKGYNVYSNIDDINELIDIIVKWYEFKYSKGGLEVVYDNYITKKYGKYNRINSYHIDELYANMGYTELMYRIPTKLHSMVECHYKGKINKKDIEVKIYNTTTNIKSSIPINFNKYDGRLTAISEVTLDRSLNIKLEYIEDFMNKENFSKEIDYTKLDFSDIENVVVTHNLDLELRNKIFELIVLKLFFSDENEYFGYIRAKKFVDEFNSYIKELNLSIEKLNDMILKSYIGFDNNKEYFEKIFNEIFINNKECSLEKIGLTFDTIKNLKNNGVYRLGDITENKMIIFLNSIYEISCDRDREIIKHIVSINNNIVSTDPFMDELNSNLEEENRINSLRKYFMKNKR